MFSSSSRSKRVLVTGANGFVGQGLIKLIAKEFAVIAATRTQYAINHAQNITVGDIGINTDWSAALRDVDSVVHLAGEAHSRTGCSVSSFQQVNVLGSIALAKQALKAKVRRFIFLSSIGVNGSSNATPFCEESLPNPSQPYALSKYYAECALRDIFQGTSTEFVVIRPPLVYSGQAPGNFQTLLRIVASGFPLPLAGIQNQRSMISLHNLTDFLRLCLIHPSAANNLFVISDSETISTPQILATVARGMGKKTNLIWSPVSLLWLGAEITGKQGIYTQLCGSLTINISKARTILGWKPVYNVIDAMEAAGHEYINARNRLTKK